MAKKRIIFISLIIIGIIVPVLVYAALVPCGRRCCEWGDGITNPKNECVEPCDPENVSWEEAQPCTFCDIFRMLQTIVNYIWWALLIIAPLFIIAGGIMILTAGVKPDQLDAGKRIITGTVVGLVIAFLSWTILNMVFLTLVKTPAEGGFPWPWNEIRCTKGTINEQSAEETATSNNTYCHLQIVNAVDQMVYQYDTATECYTECPPHCVGPGINCETWCCLDQNLGGRDNVCSGAIEVGTDRCDIRSQPGSCLGGEYYCALGVIDQVGRAATQLTDLLRCIKTNLPAVNTITLTSITDNGLDRCLYDWNVQCALGIDSCTGLCCAHGENSLHYGGSGCRGTSYAVDIAETNLINNIQAAVNTCASSSNIFQGVQVILESTHIHLEMDGLSRVIGCL